jgi:deoxycytidylate deaminase
MNEENIKRYLAKCYELATDSPDRSNQNGAIIVMEHWGSVPVGFPEVLSEGRNEFPPGIEATEELITNREKKLFYIEHAERNAIYSLFRKYNSCSIPPLAGPKGLTMICQWFACADCARAIALSGIKKVIGHKERMDMTPDRWKASVDAGLQLLRDCGVELEFYSGKIDCVPIIVNGEKWYP